LLSILCVHHEVSLEAKLADVLSDLGLLAIERHQVLRVGQVQRRRLKLGFLNKLLQVNLRWLNEPQVLILVRNFLIDKWR